MERESAALFPSDNPQCATACIHLCRVHACMWFPCFARWKIIVKSGWTLNHTNTHGNGEESRRIYAAVRARAFQWTRSPCDSLPSPLGFFLLCLQIFHLYVKNFARTTESYIELFCWMNIFGFRTSVSLKVIKGALWLRNCAKCDEYRVSFNQVGAKSCIEIFFRSVNPREKWEILLYIDNLDFTCDVTETLRICMSEHWISDWNLFRSPNKRVYTSSAARSLVCHLQRESLLVHRSELPARLPAAGCSLVARLFIFFAFKCVSKEVSS